MLVISWIHALVSTHRKQNQDGVDLNLDKRGEKAYVKEDLNRRWPDVIMRNFIAILQLKFPVDTPVP